jgi:tetratricopeptide (TPR) repeat protein
MKKYAKLLLATIPALALSCIAAAAPGAAGTTNFNYFIRCTNQTLPPDDRIRFCKALVGSGEGIVADRQFELLIAAAYREKRDFADAFEIYNAIVGPTPVDRNAVSGNEGFFANTYAERGITYAVSGNYDAAMADAAEVLKLAPTNPFGYNNRCWTRAIAGRELDAAIADCNEALKRGSGAANTLDSRGMVNFKRGDFQTALADYSAALDANSKLASSLYMRGVVKHRLEDADGGDADIARATQLDPNVANEMSLYGVAP